LVKPSARISTHRITERGFSVLETLIAAVILVILGTAIVTTGLKSRTQIDYEEVRRRAILLAQERLETVRATFPYDSITATSVGATVTLDGTTFTIKGGVIDPVPAYTGGTDTLSVSDDAKAVSDTVSWTATGGSPGALKTVTRRVVMNTIIFRGL